jgi:NDP-sugar pyrophosphorylase family protein
MEGKPVLKAVIMVGGPSKGTRFRPLSMEGFPKPLFPVGGKPMVYHHIKACCEYFPTHSNHLLLLQEVALIN